MFDGANATKEPSPTQVSPTHSASYGPFVGRYVRLFILLAVYAAILHWTYAAKISPLFSYLGQRYRTPDALNYSISFGLAGLILTILPRTLRKPSDFIVWVLYVMACVPSILVPQYADIASIPNSLELAVYVALGFALIVVLTHGPPSRGLAFTVSVGRTPWLILASWSLLFYGYLIYTTGFHINFVGLLEVQDVRFQYRETISEIGPALAYGIGIQGYIVNPLLMAKGIFVRKPALLAVGAVGILGQLLIYSLTGYKLIILSVPAAIAVSMMFGWSKKRAGSVILSGVVFSSVLALLWDEIAGGYVNTQLFINRLLLTPGTLSAAYVMVFDGQPKAEWGYSFLASFVDYSYSTSPAFLVGAAFTGDPQTSANANIFADGYANLGYPGILVEALALVLLLRLVNVAGSHLPVAVSSVLLLVPTLALVNTSVFTSVLTGGFAAGMVIMTLLPSTGWGRQSLPISDRSPPAA